MDRLWPVLNLVMNLWYMIMEFILKLKKLLGLRINLKNLNGPRLITQFYYMGGGKKKLMEEQLNIGCFKILGVIIGEKKLMDKKMDGSECKEGPILMVLKVLLKRHIQSFKMLLKGTINIKNYNFILIQKLQVILINIKIQIIND